MKDRLVSITMSDGCAPIPRSIWERVDPTSPEFDEALEDANREAGEEFRQRMTAMGGTMAKNFGNTKQ